MNCVDEIAAGVFGKQRPLIVFWVSLRKNKPYVWISQEKLFVISAIQPNLGILQGIILQYMALFSIFVRYRMRLGNTIAQKQAFGLVLLSPFRIFVQYRVHLQCMPYNLITQQSGNGL